MWTDSLQFCEQIVYNMWTDKQQKLRLGGLGTRLVTKYTTFLWADSLQGSEHVHRLQFVLESSCMNLALSSLHVLHVDPGLSHFY